MDDSASIAVPSDPFPTILPAAADENDSIFPSMDVSINSTNPPLSIARLSDTLDNNVSLVNGRPNRKRSFGFPAGFRSMTDKLSFMKKSLPTGSNTPASDTSTKKKEFKIEGSSTSVTPHPVSLEWVQSVSGMMFLI